ncbi:hypothetical protein C1645_841491 [Glomus cerebriforme]|uniref:Uncharacterized protein n=1 Tax=Glomus cerebriforme TaxID=658196 RepID=A0A397S9W7_9GLOM|nr:hypothetical protein C1645_841491 [Glomus cerebriforme]
MVNENQIPIQKPYETVYEIKVENETPSFAEFMKDYEVDKNLNYDDLESNSVGEVGAGASAGAGGVIAGGSAGFSSYKYSDNIGDIRFGSASLGGEIGEGPGGSTVGYSANVDAVNFHTKSGIRGNAGIDVGSNFTAGPGGVEVKAAGFGISAGKKTGISTPFGGVSVDFEETCKQQ